MLHGVLSRQRLLRITIHCHRIMTNGGRNLPNLQDRIAITIINMTCHPCRLMNDRGWMLLFVMEPLYRRMTKKSVRNIVTNVTELLRLRMRFRRVRMKAKCRLLLRRICGDRVVTACATSRPSLLILFAWIVLFHVVFHYLCMG